MYYNTNNAGISCTRSDSHRREYERYGVFKLHEVLDYIHLAEEKKYLGFTVKMFSQRYALFEAKGVVCCKCGIEGVFFGLERQIKDIRSMHRAHFNLYGINKDGIEVMFTKDHIIPKSKGGADTQENYQVMCEVCNLEKADKIITTN